MCVCVYTDTNTDTVETDADTHTYTHTHTHTHTRHCCTGDVILEIWCQQFFFLWQEQDVEVLGADVGSCASCQHTHMCLMPAHTHTHTHVPQAGTHTRLGEQEAVPQEVADVEAARVEQEPQPFGSTRGKGAHLTQILKSQLP